MTDRKHIAPYRTTLVFATLAVVSWTFILGVAPLFGAPPAMTPPWETQIYRMAPSNMTTRWYTAENRQGLKGQGGRAKFGRKGAPCLALPAGQKLVLADIQGPGTIRRIWSTLWTFNQPASLRGLKIEMFWDGADQPAVQAPFGDFFGQSFGQMTAFENDCFASPEGRSFNCFVPMPFKKSARIVVTNESELDTGIYFDVAATLDDPHGDDMLYFHAAWRRENPTELRRDMTILPRITGRGRFLGVHHQIRLNPCCRHFWWGEGEVKIYLDGDDDRPTLVGTGTEDYIGAGYGQGRFDHRFQGNHYVADGNTAYGFYRFHIPDPVFFHTDVRVTLQVMGGPSYAQMLQAMDADPNLRFMKAGDGTAYYTRAELEANPKRAEVMERVDDHTAMAYWYLDKPSNALPPLAPVAERFADLP